jgi:acetyl esterase/lipase
LPSFRVHLMAISRIRPRVLVACLLLAAPACRVTDLPIWRLDASSQCPDKFHRVRDIDYDSEPAADPIRHQLDVYLPVGVKDFPVVMFVHGGAWMAGDNRCCGLYSSVGEFLASHGIGAVLPNYRLSPGVKHPEHIKDVAKAFAWTKAHIGEFGGRCDQLFVAGHSAGGHLVSLLATDEQYLKALGLSTADIRGVIALSGVYRIPGGKLDLRIGGSDAMSFRLDEVAPFRRESSPGPAARADSGIPLRLNVYGSVFGNDSDEREDASPIAHVRRGLPPFLIVTAEHDLPTLTQTAEEFYAALRTNGGKAQLVRAAGRNHSSIMFMAVQEGDAVGNGMVEFVRSACR